MRKFGFASQLAVAALILQRPEGEDGGVALADPPGMNLASSSAPTVPFEPPTAPEIPSPTSEDDRERKAKNPRLTPPEGGWKEFPPADGSFDPEKHSAPAKKDFSPLGPFYENYRLKKIQQEKDDLIRQELEIKEDIQVWEDCGMDAEKVAARQ
jgi:hypothetical protein